VAVIKKLWDVTWDLWEQQNGFLHQAEYQDTLHNAANLNSEIRFQLQQGSSNLPRRTQYLFEEGNTGKLLNTSIGHQQQWLQSVQVVWMMANERQAAQDQSMATSKQLMRVWLDEKQTGSTQGLIEMDYLWCTMITTF
jgi:hypothetical protein